MLIGLAGKARAGKDTVAAMIGGQRLAFAAPIKAICRDLFHFSHEQLEGQLKEMPDPRYTRPDGTHLTPRFAMQTLGTDWGRECDPDLWVKFGMMKAANLLRHGQAVVFSDVRFENEARAIREAGGEVWRIVRPGEGLHGFAAGHVSEQTSPELVALCNRTIRNYGTLEDLQGEVERCRRAYIEQAVQP